MDLRPFQTKKCISYTKKEKSFYAIYSSGNGFIFSKKNSKKGTMGMFSASSFICPFLRGWGKKANFLELQLK